ncbi:armadillo repeat-containing protein 2 [Cololabis saira]|uniref:armadillo repeat-containing protein 2 n=1 Tax=Cololabis saira TaxID=129043 RepID=UPI002AD3FC76|nr:armadillo repeat-containing protein 2 [Cololabis saira]
MNTGIFLGGTLFEQILSAGLHLRLVKERLSPGQGQTQLSVKQLSGINHTTIFNGHPKPDRCTTTSKSCKLVQPGVDSGVRATVCRAERRTDLGCRDNAAITKEDAETSLWNSVIAPVLNELESVAAGSSEGSVDRLCDLCDHLHGTLADADTLNRQCKRRSWILRTLFRLIDLNYAQLNLRIAKLCLTLCVRGNNLLNICKLIFKISRTDDNDILFENNSIIDSLLGLLNNEDVGVSGEALLYCVGTLKFLSGNITFLRLMLDKNCIGVAQKLIQKLCTVEDTHFTIAGHILVQLTATLRNVADHPDSRPHFVSFSILPALCLVLRHHSEDQDICLNVSRIYSKLSSYSESCLSLAQTHDCYPLFIELLRKHHQKQELVVRLLFTLGNLTAKGGEPRQLLFQCDGCMETLLQLYKSYQRKDPAPYTPIQRGTPFSTEPANPLISAREVDDVLVKLVTVLANISIHPAVGSTLTTNTTCIKLLMETLELRSVQESEELLVKVAATITNLSFYQVEGSEIRSNQLAIATLLLKLMLSSSMDAMLEATRVYGNLSHCKNVQDFIMQNKVHRFVVTLLDSKSAEMCFSACGVLTNLALDPPNRVCLALEEASVKLVDCLRDFGPGDWQLAGHVCRAMWNLTGGGSEKLLDTQQRETLLEMLSAFVDEEEALKWTENEHLRDFHRACWELEFLPVAQKLMMVLQSPDLTA